MAAMLEHSSECSAVKTECGDPSNLNQENSNTEEQLAKYGRSDVKQQNTDPKSHVDIGH